jgi:hypothetical protein
MRNILKCPEKWGDNMGTTKEKIIEKAIEIIKSKPDGIRYSDLVKEIHKKYPRIPIKTIDGTVWNLEARVQNEVYKPARGLFRHVSFREKEINKEEQKPSAEVEDIKEADFYEPFARWLVDELEECKLYHWEEIDLRINGELRM